MTDQNPTAEADADTVANRAAQVITRMGADVRALTGERDRYRTAWRSARERAQAYGEGILRVVKDREQYQQWLKQAEERLAAVPVPPPADQTALSLTAVERQFLTFALDQAAEEMCLGDGFTAEDQAALETLRRMAAEEQPAETPEVDLQVWPLHRVLSEVRCGSKNWTWEEEWADLDRRHTETGYLETLEAQIRENGITMPVLIGSDGRLWDGHHRLRIAVRLGIGYVPVEITPKATERPAVGEQPETQEAPNPRTVCTCGHTRGEHVTVSGRLLCDACDPDSTDNLVCKEFEAL